jgi:hypothetical protein
MPSYGRSWAGQARWWWQPSLFDAQAACPPLCPCTDPMHRPGSVCCGAHAWSSSSSSSSSSFLSLALVLPSATAASARAVTATPAPAQSHALVLGTDEPAPGSAPWLAASIAACTRLPCSSCSVLTNWPMCTTSATSNGDAASAASMRVVGKLNQPACARTPFPCSDTCTTSPDPVSRDAYTSPRTRRICVGRCTSCDTTGASSYVFSSSVRRPKTYRPKLRPVGVCQGSAAAESGLSSPPRPSASARTGHGTWRRSNDARRANGQSPACAPATAAHSHSVVLDTYVTPKHQPSHTPTCAHTQRKTNTGTYLSTVEMAAGRPYSGLHAQRLVITSLAPQRPHTDAHVSAGKWP